jgi:citronellyl-CoA dehydrogenase
MMSKGRGLSLVMPGLVPGIHVLKRKEIQDVDGRDKPGHDAVES